MGNCFASRFENRNSDLCDFNTMSASFVGGEGRYLSKDVCPVDKFFLNYCSAKSRLPDGACKEPYELLQINSKSMQFEREAEGNSKILLVEIMEFCDAVHKHLRSLKLSAKDHKDQIIGQKYSI